MMKRLFILSLFAIALAAPLHAQQPSAMNAMTYYVGTWACIGGPSGQPTETVAITYSLSGGILRSSIRSSGMKEQKPFAISGASSYDARHRRYVQVLLYDDGDWVVSYADPRTDNTERWSDRFTSESRLAHAQILRIDRNHYTLTAYNKASTPVGKLTCRRAA